MNKAEYNSLIKQISRLLDSLPPRRTDVLLERRIRQALNRAVFLRDKLIPEVTKADSVREVPFTTNTYQTTLPPD